MFLVFKVYFDEDIQNRREKIPLKCNSLLKWQETNKKNTFELKRNILKLLFATDILVFQVMYFGVSFAGNLDWKGEFSTLKRFFTGEHAKYFVE